MGTYEISGTYLRAARPDPHYMQKTFSTAAHTINATTAQPRPTEQFMATQVRTFFFVFVHFFSQFFGGGLMLLLLRGCESALPCVRRQ